MALEQRENGYTPAQGIFMETEIKILYSLLSTVLMLAVLDPLYLKRKGIIPPESRFRVWYGIACYIILYIAALYGLHLTYR